MRVIMLGFGKMGKSIAEKLHAEGDLCTAVDPNGGDHPHISVVPELTDALLDDADVCIDFSSPKALRQNLERVAGKKPYVLGTTGWKAEQRELQQLNESFGGTLVYASNFSLGVQLFFQSVRDAAQRVSLFPDFDVSGFEVHHREKTDSPSGTALSVVNILQECFPHKTRVLFDRPDEKISPDTLHFSSLRCGHFPGTHEVLFDCPSETMRIEMVSRNREGFTAGAVWAARWITGALDASKGKNLISPGWYLFDEVLERYVSDRRHQVVT